jgi:hypothetical protein
MHETQGDWLPARAALHPTGLYLSLREIAAAGLQDAFMQETIARIGGRETIVQIAREDLGKGADGCAPAGIIFHVARCGSTLVSQLLKQLDGLIVYAEPLPVNEILRPPHAWTRGELVGALRSLSIALARHARNRYVLKLTSWNTLFCDIVAEAFPETPWVLCLRDPVEVGVSLLKQPPGWLTEFSPVVDPDAASKSREDYVARLYGALCKAASGLARERGLLLPYNRLPKAVWENVAPHFSLAVDGAARKRMSDAAGRNSKAPPGRESKFDEDSAAKRAAASGELHRAVDAFARPQLLALEKRFAP